MPEARWRTHYAEMHYRCDAPAGNPFPGQWFYKQTTDPWLVLKALERCIPAAQDALVKCPSKLYCFDEEGDACTLPNCQPEN